MPGTGTVAPGRLRSMHRYLTLLALLLLVSGCQGSLVLGGLLGDDDDSSAADDDDGADDDDQVDDDDVQPDDDDVQPDDDDVQPDDDDAVVECPDDGHEPNDTQSAASPLPEGTHNLHVCTDGDWFEVCWSEGDEVSMRFQFSHADGDIDVTLHQPSGELIYESDSGDDNEGMGGIIVPFDGCRYVHVYLYDNEDPGQLGNPYTFIHEVN
jgi:hypothetical protein